jgi:pimeloyl-ACP methyl ester carboxylesterase
VANFVQRHPQSIGRVVFAAMHGPDHGLRLPLVLDLQLKRLTALLGDSPYAGVDLYEQTKAAMQRLDKTPAALTITDRRTQKPVELTVGKVALQAILQAKLSNGRALPAVPALITTTAQGDYALLTGEIEGLYNSMAAGVSSMTMASICADGASPWRRQREQSEAAQSLFGDVPNLQLRPEVCRLVGQPVAQAETHGAMSSSTPALFLSGTLDSNGGPVQAEEIRWGFPNSVHIIIDYGAHETLPSAEVQQTVAAFFRGEDLRGRQLRFAPPKFLSVEQVKSGGPPRP